MHYRVSLLLSGAAFATVVALGSVGSPLTAQATLSLTDGVYTAAQAERGRRLYLVNCATCHAENLNGGRFYLDEPVPALRRETLFEGWPELNAFYDALRAAMPADEPMALLSEEYVDVLAYLLSANGYPSGTAELSSDPVVLTRITIARPVPKAGAP